MLASMEPKNTEETFLEQYRDLDDDTLRQIAGGSVPYRNEEQFVHTARRAARRLLRERGASKVPRVPLWDVNGPLPTWVRALFVTIGLSLLAGAATAWVATIPDRLDEEAACEHVRSVMRASDWGHRVQLQITQCLTAPPSDEIEGERIVPIIISGCVQIRKPILERWSVPEHRWECRKVQQFLPENQRFVCGDSAPASLPSSDLCGTSTVHVADIVERQGHPWTVRLLSSY